jgi:SAM-dependent methyltransferase
MPASGFDDQQIDYGLHYGRWHDESPEHVETMRLAIGQCLAPILAGRRRGAALDLGSGMGFGVLALSDLGYQAEGFEADDSQVEVSRRLGVNVTQGSDLVKFLHERVGRFSVVTLFDVLEHIPKETHMPLMRAVREALAPGGLCVVRVPNANALVWARHFYGDWTHYWAFTEDSLRFVMLNAGYREVSFIEPSMIRPSVRLWKPAARRYARSWLIRWLWRQVLVSEYAHDPLIQSAPIGLNLLCVGE